MAIRSVEQLYAIRPSDLWVAEAERVAPRTVPEKLVRCLWFDQRWRPTGLCTLAGEEVIVHDPGRWNVQAGPDFQQAVLAFADGSRQRGDVEIHRCASGWIAHRHHLDARYNRVILHVFLWNDRHSMDAVRADGQPVPQVALAPYLPQPLAAYQAEIVLEDYPYKHAPLPGRCYEALRQIEPAAVQQLLDRAGDVRLRRRVERWAARAAEVDGTQVLYEAMMRSLGSAGYRQQFQALARLVTWQELQHCLAGVAVADRQLVAEALLLGLAGMLEPVRTAGTTVDPETRDYVNQLSAHWTGLPADMRRRAWRHPTWRQPHVRPANTPERRLAGMAQLLAQFHTPDLLEAGLRQSRAVVGRQGPAAARALCQTLTAWFDLPLTSYWSRRTRFGGRLGNSQRLIGTQRALTIVVDAVLPVLLLATQSRGEARLRAGLLAAYRAAPRLPDNARLRYMARRLLGNDPALLALVTGARQQQGMLQIFYDHCDNDEGQCRGCDFPLLTTS
ncbi:hypothetical protein NKDENANG_00229 [Candidatus Entotheonellaceae bacterium PAL068K]